MPSQAIALQQPTQGFPGVFHQRTQRTATVAERPERHYTRAELDALTDNQLIDLTLAGTTAAFEILVTRHQRQMYALALKMLRNHDDALDIAQDVFLKAYEVLGSFQKKSTFHTWLYRITVNFCINHLRRDKAQHHIQLETYHAVKSAEAFENLDTLELQDELNEAIRQLPEKQQTTVILRVCEGLPYKEIAKILDCSVGTVKANYFHAVKNLKKAMKNTIVAHAS
ncbi:sigma-70 family RNA polymerase sigma factor [candidate division KSB3 bacterium]|uniref:RNA polymerase sigma factor n=1 Tax=candidate division KSB3 bacterium TaxID=2044937 RepID=A0A9D5JXV2_9BACT|nr:sigma-70 family RNA polymerase sigma factor [candidate division KSB3 bacterium]MBD3326164.1 sigma-70 family RNA polymerase sigma factor [candidate division KSB3 bacterium]